ncbi:AzlD domain-containing protein [Pseudonocardia eucalypti]|uniref:AzlD domain-containing protein n=1 Tax=Pseudonocardia eucalypti TaxID=648755 RepID=A0ABP9QTA1_9PSEU|nr:branched-subunit amino acid transport protein [Pseudonocardia eucalypti]
MTGWVVGALAGGTYLIRLSGLVLRERLRVLDRFSRLFDLSALVLIAALTASITVFEGEVFAGWARPAGVLLAAIAAWCKAPLVVVIVIAAGVTAGLRALGVP